MLWAQGWGRQADDRKVFFNPKEGLSLMTMWLTYPVMFKVKPVPNKEGWFEIAGRPHRSDYSEVYEFAGDYRDELVRGARLVGWHENDNLLEDDPRFNHHEAGAWAELFEDEDAIAEPSFAVAKTGDDEYEAMFMCNAPEGLLFEVFFDELDGPENPDAHFPDYKHDSAEKSEAHYKKVQAQRAAQVKALMKKAKAHAKKASVKPGKKKAVTA